MNPTDLTGLADLDVDEVRADVARLELALRIARAVLAELEREPDTGRQTITHSVDIARRLGLTLFDTRTASPSAASDHAPAEHPVEWVEPAAGVTRTDARVIGYDEPEPELLDTDTVRPGEDPVEPTRAAAPPATPPTTPAAPATPPDSPPPDETPAERVTNISRVEAYYREHPGEWIAPRVASDALGFAGRDRDKVQTACKTLKRRGVLEHNGEWAMNGRYRLPEPEPAAEPAAGLDVDAVHRTPDLEGADHAPAAGPIHTPPPPGPPPPAQPHHPPVSRRVRRLLEEERNGQPAGPLKALTAQPGPLEDQDTKPTREGTLEGRIVNALAYRPATLRDLKATLDIPNDQGRELYATVARLVDEGTVTAHKEPGRQSNTYSADGELALS